MQLINKNHYDFLSGRYTFIKQRDFTEVLCRQNHLNQFFPDINPKDMGILKSMIQLWIQFSIFQSSLQRIILILEDKENLDKINLLREIQSPRQQIVKRIPWICFQLQMKTQIWLSQFETFKLLDQNKSGFVTQLNMGEGKTQIIIPMLVLNEIYIKKQFVPRVNILSPLYKEAQDNYFKFFSITGFRVNVFPIYFNRTVQVNSNNIKRLQYVFNLFKKQSLILIDRDSHLSMILKLRQKKLYQQHIYQNENINYVNCNQKDKWIFRNTPLLDIFDEVDALMTAKKSFVYAIGGSEALPDSRLRFQYNRILMQILLKQMLDYLIQHQMIVIEQSIPLAKLAITEGRFPNGLRFLNKNEKIMQFREILVQKFLTDYIPPQFQFYKQLNKIQKEKLIKFLVDSNKNSIQTIESYSSIPQKVYNQIYAVRGIVAYGVLQHSLSLRCGVDYGVPGKDNMKRVGVPYQAADVPSKRSQYSHPEVATILSYLAYFNQGLKFSEFQEALRTLMNLTESSQNYNYQLWLSCIEQEDKKPKIVRDTKQINQESITQKNQLYNCFKFCRNTIVFWLIHCVFPIDLAQFNQSITASSWDIAHSAKSLGFSGTKDSHWILPNYLKLLLSQNNEINGTDGKMIKLMIQHTLQVLELEQTSQDLWKRYVSKALQLKVGCIIDAGAILAGKSLQNIIVPWISNEKTFKKLGYRGISYCDENGRWRVYDTSSHTIIDRQTSIAEHQTFVIFDEARTRGADIKMKSNIKAALSLGPNMTKDKLMQAVGRLRKFGRNQQIYILSTKQNYSKIEGFNLQINTIKEKTKKIIEWVCINSINDNKNMMYPNTKLAWIHFQNINSINGIITQKFNPSLNEMYREPIKYDTVSNLNDQMANSFKKLYQQNQFTDDLVRSVKQYGGSHKVRCQHLENICERETQMVEQKQKEKEKELALLRPVQESKNITKYFGSLSIMDIKLDDRLSFSKNFKQCTQYESYGYQKNIQSNNELCQIHFALIKPLVKEFMIITQREANILMLKGTLCLGPNSIKQARNVEFVVRFKDVTIDLPFIRQNGLERALTDAQFFNGQQNFEKRQLLIETIKINSLRMNQIKLSSLICHFVERRRTVEDKFYCSDLQAVLKQIINSK